MQMCKRRLKPASMGAGHGPGKQDFRKEEAVGRHGLFWLGDKGDKEEEEEG